MARKIKRTSRRKSRPAAPLAIPPPPLAAPPPSRRHKLLGLVVLLAFVFVAVEGLFFLKPKKSSRLTATPVTRFTGEGKESGVFKAWDVAPVGADRLALTDQGANSVLIFDTTGNFIRRIGGEKGKGERQFNEPSGIASNDKGDFYVMDAWNAALKGFNRDGDSLQVLDLTRINSFYGPRGIAWDGQDFFVADTGTHRVLEISPANQVVTIWGKQGSLKGQYYNPIAVVVGKDKNIYVGDSDNQRVQILDPKGNVIRILKIGNKVNDVAVDESGRILVSSTEGAYVKMFNKNGKLMGTLVDNNGSPDPFRNVNGMAAGPNNTLYCTDGGAVAIWRLPAP